MVDGVKQFIGTLIGPTPLEPAHAWYALAMLAVLAVFMRCALWRVRVTGGVTARAREARTFR